MNILVACEESQRVTIAFRSRGHRAFSCDVLDCSGGHPEWHVKSDVIPLLNGNCSFKTIDNKIHEQNGNWDMIIAFPPCTYVSNAGAKHLFRGGNLNLERYYKGLCGKALFETIRAADCKRIVIENPLPSKIFNYPPHTQVIQPYYFGEPVSKRTLLWIKGVIPLVPTYMVNNPKPFLPSGSGYKGTSGHCSKERSKTFQGIAVAMAEQWG